MEEPAVQPRRVRRLVSIGPTGALLRDRNFYPYLIGNMLSNTGTWFQVLAQTVLVYRLTHSTVLVGVLGFSQYAAVFAFAPITGSVADRFDRRRVIAVTQSGAAIVTAALTVITALGHASAALVICFALFLGLSNAFTTPAMLAFVPTLVGRELLATTLALNSMSFSVGRALGPLLAAVAIKTLGTAWAFGINAASFLAMVVGVLAVRPVTPQTMPASRPKLRESIRLVLRDTRLAGLLLAIFAMNVATDPAITLGPAFMTHVFHRSDSLAGLLIGAFGLGAVVAALTWAHRLVGTRANIATSLGATGAGLVVFSFSPTLAVGLAGLFILGVGYVASNTAATSRLQIEVADEHRGRIMALWSLAFLGARPISSLVDGTLASLVGLHAAAFAMSLPALLAAAVLFAGGRRRRAAAQ